MNKLTILLVAGLGSTAHANAFLLNEFDARAVGRGNAVVATDTDPSSIYYNVGGLAGVQGSAVTVSGSLVKPNATFTDVTGEKVESNTNPQGLAGAFGSVRVHDLIAIGIGASSPFGLAISWPSNSQLTDVLRKESLKTFFITPAIGANLDQYVPGLLIGGGFDVVPATVELTQNIFFGMETGQAHLGATAVGVGGRIGVQWTPQWVPDLTVGAMWRSDVTLDFRGTGDFDAAPPFRGALPPDGNVQTTIELPQQVSLGAAYRPIHDLEVEANAVWTDWSEFKTLDINVPASTGTGTMVISTPEGYKNTWTIRAGAEYNLPTYGWGFRAGYIYDPTPIPAQFLTAQLPDINRNDVTVGASKTFGSEFTGHFSFLVVLPDSRETSMDPNMPVHKGTYDVSAFVGTVSFTGKFGRSF